MARITGDDRSNSLIGTGSADQLHGLGGNDLLRAFGGNDLLDGGPGSDLLDGGSGRDTASYATYGAWSMRVDLVENVAQALDRSGTNTDALASIENVVGTDHFAGDEIVGNGLANRIEAGDGSDRIDPGGGDDRIFGGGDSDGVTWFTGDGADYFDGGESSVDDDGFTVRASEHDAVTMDVTAQGARLLVAVSGFEDELITAVNLEEVSFIGDSETFGGDRVTLSDGPDARLSTQISFAIVQADAGDDLVTASGTDLGRGIWAFGGDGDDLMTGGRTGDLLIGDGGDDTLRGGGGRDDLRGDVDLSAGVAPGDDRIFGGGGDDVIGAGWGRDTAYGGSGKDEFDIGGAEAPTSLAIGDFQPRADRVVFFNLSQAAIDGLDTSGNGRFDATDSAVTVRNGSISIDFSSAFEVPSGTLVVALQDFSSLAIQDNLFGFGS